jgi:hypothetical protein
MIVSIIQSFNYANSLHCYPYELRLSDWTIVSLILEK